MKGIEKKNDEKKKIIFTEYTYVSVIALLLSGIFTFVKYNVSLTRLISSFKDFGTSVAHYFMFIFGDALSDVFGIDPAVTVTVNDIPDVDIFSFVPFDASTFEYKIKAFIPSFFSAENFLEYNFSVLNVLYKFTLYVSLFLPVVIIIVYLLRDRLLSGNEFPAGHVGNVHGFFKKAFSRCFVPVKNVVSCFVNDVKEHKALLYLFLFVWLLNLNALTIIVEVLSYYFYFVSSFDFGSLFFQLVKLGIDSIIMFGSGNFLLWLSLAGVLLHIRSSGIALDDLRHKEAMNCGFAKSTDLISIAIGPPGVGKTAFITDLTLSWANIFKQKALDIIYENDLLFPHFPWMKFEKAISTCMETHDIYCLPCIDIFVDCLESEYNRTPPEMAFNGILFGYDSQLYGVKRNVGNREISLFDVMREYGKAYFIYNTENSNLSNYSVRFDGVYSDSDYFRIWNGDFFGNSVDFSDSFYSHILDQDVLRMGKLVDIENPYSGSFSFGIYTNTEWGKGRGNQLTLQGIDKDADEANQKNDLYSYALKMSRHASSMVGNFPFFRFIGDEQRPQSLNQDLRDMCSVLSIVSKSDLKIAYPHFGFQDLVYKKIYDPFRDFYYKYREARGDESIVINVMKGFVSLFSNYYRYMYNKYGYYVLEIKTEAGITYGDGETLSEPSVHEYYLSLKKIYSNRYSTDCYQQFFAKRELDCAFGINDYPSYEGIKMSYDEMQAQHDYFIMELMKIMSGEKEMPSEDGKIRSRSFKSKKTVKKYDEFGDIEPDIF